MKWKNITPLYIAEGGVIAALYVVLTLTFAPISFGPVQLRVSEALTIMPMFTPAAIPSLFVGCILANIIGGAVILDVIFGSIATLIGAVFAYLLRKNRWLVPIPTVISNSLIIPFVLKFGYGIDISYGLLVVYILIGEILGSYILGELLCTFLLKQNLYVFKKGISKKERNDE